VLSFGLLLTAIIVKQAAGETEADCHQLQCTCHIHNTLTSCYWPVTSWLEVLDIWHHVGATFVLNQNTVWQFIQQLWYTSRTNSVTPYDVGFDSLVSHWQLVQLQDYSRATNHQSMLNVVPYRA